MLVVSFTGTREEPSHKQTLALTKLFRHIEEREWSKLPLCEQGKSFGDPLIELHHGDCVRSDCLAHEIALTLGLRIVIHPPTNARFRALCEGADLVLPPRDYLQRNRDVVDAGQLLIAMPHIPTETLRSGTWSTIRYARKRQRSIFIVQQNGIITTERISLPW